MIDWIFDHVPYWVWAVALGVALIATYPMWSTIWLMLPRWLKVALLAVAGLVTAYLAGRNRGVNNEKQRQKEADAKAVKRRLDTNEEVNRMRRDDRDKSFNRWLRD